MKSQSHFNIILKMHIWKKAKFNNTLFPNMKIVESVTSVYPDKVAHNEPHYEPPYLNLHCLPSLFMPLPSKMLGTYIVFWLCTHTYMHLSIHIYVHLYMILLDSA